MNVGIYQADKYTAYFYPKNIVICTRPQAFRVRYLNPSDRVHLDEVKLAIINGDIKTVTDVVDVCNEFLIMEDCAKPTFTFNEMLKNEV